MFRIQPMAPSPRSQEVGIPGGCPLNTIATEISQAGTEEDAPVHRWHLKMDWGGLVVFAFLPPCPPQELMEWIWEQGLCVSHWQQGPVFGCFHQQISGCLKFPVTLTAFRSPAPLARDWKASNWHYYVLSSRKVECCWRLSVSLPRLHLQPAQPSPSPKKIWKNSAAGWSQYLLLQYV